MQISWLIDPPTDLVDRILSEMSNLHREVTIARAQDEKRRRAASSAKTRTARQSTEAIVLTDKEVASLPSMEITLDPERYAALRARLPYFLQALVKLHRARPWGARTEINTSLNALEKHLKALRAKFDALDNDLSHPRFSRSLELGARSLKRSRTSLFAGEPSAFLTKYRSHRIGTAFCVGRELDAALIDLRDLLNHAQSYLRYGLAPRFYDVSFLRKELTKCTPHLIGNACADALHLVSVDQIAIQKITGRRNETQPQALPAHRELLDWMKRQLDALQGIVNQLKIMIQEFDQLDEYGREDWQQRGNGELGQSARLYLAAFLKKGTGSAPITDLVREIAPLYQLVFDKPFRVNDNYGASYHNRVARLSGESARTSRSLRVSDYRIGQSMLFACGVIRALELDYLATPYEHHEISTGSSIQPTYAERLYDVRKYNREAGLHGRRYREYSDAGPLDQRTFDLVVLIGDAWDRVSKSR